ncbi:MAG TPA: hypothetical protein PLY44_03730 [Candidatus Pacearchaeota archaeon]|nr:hypothetical protein [Candidatus Pacearchaeota archaeon]
MEIEPVVEFILKARKRGYRDDAIERSLLDKGYPEDIVLSAKAIAGKPKRIDKRSRAVKESRTSIVIVLEDWLKDTLERMAKDDGISMYNEVKKTLIRGIPPEYASAKTKRQTKIRKRLTPEQNALRRITNEKARRGVRKTRKKSSRQLKRVIRRNDRLRRRSKKVGN